jgi:6-phosphogluconolactonase
VKIFADADALAAHAARWITALAKEKDGFAVALSGGSTPKALYRALAAADDFPWDRVQWYFGDERFVPPDDAQSNCRMAREAMLFRAPPGNVHPVPTVGVTPDEAAARYEAELRARATAPLFDLVLLGLGTDGHTASLFPGTSALDERERWVRATRNGRITLTYPALENATRIAFLVTGADKRAMLARLRDGDTTIPAGRVTGDITIFADEAAAG